VEIYTIGFTQTTAERFFGRLRAALAPGQRHLHGRQAARRAAVKAKAQNTGVSE